MGQVYSELNDKLTAFICAQRMFFVGSAPLSAQGHVNISPKGYDTFRILDSKTVMYLDYGGSGIETHAHVLENERIILMFCAFEGKPNILRLYGRGEVCAFHDEGFAEKLAHFPDFDRARAIITVHRTRVADSCGYSIPYYAYEGERDQLRRSHEHRSIEDWHAHRYDRNAESIDGLPGLVPPPQK